MAYGDYDGPDKPDKGKENGSCNRGRCQCSPAIWYNTVSYKWYCTDCKIAIESANQRDWANMIDKPMFETREMMTTRKDGPMAIKTETHAEKMARKRQARTPDVVAVVPSHEEVKQTLDSKKASHRVMVERLGMIYTEIPETPTPLDEPRVVERMTDVIETTKRCPDIYDNLNDFDLGNVVRMLYRSSHAHEAVCVATRNRIWTLSKEKQALAKALLDAYRESPVVVYRKDNDDELFMLCYDLKKSFTLKNDVLTPTTQTFFKWAEHGPDDDVDFRRISTTGNTLNDYLTDKTTIVVPI